MTAAAIMRRSDGHVMALAMESWVSDPCRGESDLIRHLPDPLLDIGCGPGRIVAEAMRLGKRSLGIDVAPGAIELTQRRGGVALQRSVFDGIPGTGRWGAAVLFDGNVGIGGDPAALLRRCRELVRPGGVVLVEVEPPGSSIVADARLEIPGFAPGPWFPWAHVGADEMRTLSEQVGLVVERITTRETDRGRRWFAWLVRPLDDGCPPAEQRR